MASITYADKNASAPSGTPERQWRDEDANEVKDVVNSKQDKALTLASLAALSGDGWMRKDGDVLTTGLPTEFDGNRLQDVADPIDDTDADTKGARDFAINSAITGLYDDRGNYDASVNVPPSTGGSGVAGAILKGDVWTISVAGTLMGTTVEPGDTIRALVDSPGVDPASWAINGAASGSTTPDASPTVKGKLKLFDSQGTEIDGTMDQNSITLGLAGKEPINTALILDNLLPWKNVKCRTTGPLPAHTINGAFTIITMSAVGAVSFDGIPLLAGDKVMVGDETVDDKEHGLFDVTTEGTVGAALVLTRSGDANSGAKLNGATVCVRQGASFAGTLWFQSTPTPTFGVSSIIFKTLPAEPKEVVGMSVRFDIPRHYGMDPNPAESGAAITLDVLGFRTGITQFMRHNAGAEPTYGSEFEVIAGAYSPSNNNLITFYSLSLTKIFVTYTRIS